MTIFEKIKVRWKERESAIGSFLKRELTIVLAVCSILGSANEYLTAIPDEWIPIWLKTAIPIAGVLSFISGKMTKKKEEVKEDGTANNKTE